MRASRERITLSAPRPHPTRAGATECPAATWDYSFGMRDPSENVRLFYYTVRALALFTKITAGFRFSPPRDAARSTKYCGDKMEKMLHPPPGAV
jgi:hypothetical protein